MSDILIATDAPWIHDEILAAIGGADTSTRWVRDGQLVRAAVAESHPDLLICDLQIGTMGAMAVTLDLRNEEGAGRLDHVRVLMLLDRQADLYLAQRSRAEGWLVKPIDAFRLRRAVTAVLADEPVYEGIPEADWPALADTASV